MPRRRERIDRPIKVLTDDVYALSSLRNVLYVAVPRVVPVVLLVALVFAGSPYLERVLVIAAIYALLALSWDFLASTTGLISLGQALFFGVGAYTTAVLNVYGGVPTVPAIVLATLVGGVVCTLLVIPCLPLRGVYFSMTTLVYPLLMARVIEATGAMGGTDGLVGVDPHPSLILEKTVIMVIAVVATFGLRRLLASDFGIVLRAIGDDDIAVQAAGIDVTRYRIAAVFIASSLGALAGAYFTHLYMFVGMSAFALDLSILPIASAVVGGVGTLVGPVVGAFLLVPLAEAARDAGALRIVVYSLLLVAIILTKPEGIMSYVARKYRQRERWVEV